MSNESKNGAAVEGYVDAASTLFRVAHPERKAQWAGRLSMHVNELAAVAGAEVPPDVVPLGLPLFAPPAPVSPPAVPTPPSGLARLAQDVASGAADPVDRVEKFLRVIEQRRDLNAFMHVDAEGARRQAADLRTRRAAGDLLGPVAGAVVAVKDCFAVRGLPLTAGTRAMPVRVPEHSAPVVQRLQEAGAIVIGMTTMHELAYGATTDNPHFGRVGHPRDAGHVAGGSSGGSAVAVAAGMADIALGSDAAGSVRMPAALCGVVGFKPSYGSLPLEGVEPLSWTLDHVGLFAASVVDVALMVDLMADRPMGAACSAPVRLPPGGIRMFRPRNYFCDVIDPSVLAAFERALDKLQSSGFALQDGVIEGLDVAPAMQYATLSAEAAEVQLDRALLDAGNIGEEVRVRLEAGQFVRAVDYIKAQRLRRNLRAALSAPFEGGAHVLVTPAVITGAPPAAATVEVAGSILPIHPALTRCTLPFNLTGLPAISLPCGFDVNGFPVGLQIVGAFGQDALVLAIAERVEAVLSSV